MRIDKFLKVSRLIKRREVAKELCDCGAVLVNGKTAKPSTEIVPGDKLTLSLGRHHLVVVINEVKPYANKDTAPSLYEILEDTIQDRPEGQ